MEILTNSTFSIWEFFRGSLVLLWFLLGLLPEGHREGTRGRNLNKSTFINTHTFGGRVYPVRHYPIAIRLRTLAFGNMVAMIVDPVNIRATCASGCSPVRLTPAVGVTTGAHYRMSTGHSSPALAHEVRGDPIIYIAPFYVLRLILKVGSFRAQYSECVPSHSFTLVFDKGEIGKVQGKEILKFGVGCKVEG